MEVPPRVPLPYPFCASDTNSDHCQGSPAREPDRRQVKPLEVAPNRPMVQVVGDLRRGVVM